MHFQELSDLCEKVRANVDAIHVCKCYYMSHAYREVKPPMNASHACAQVLEDVLTACDSRTSVRWRANVISVLIAFICNVLTILLYARCQELFQRDRHA